MLPMAGAEGIKMNKQEIYNTAEEFLDLIYNEKYSQEELEQLLILYLDKLALASNYIGNHYDDNEYPDPPYTDTIELQRLVEKRFPFLGNYYSLDNISNTAAEAEILTASAIDDIVDITSELKDFIWYWNSTSVDEALWQLKFSFDTHWGRHLRELQLYLFTRSRGL